MSQYRLVPYNPRRGIFDLEYKWQVLISVLFGIFMIILDSTVVNVAFQTLRREFGASLTSAQWVISLYVLALGITTPLSGFLGDRFGIKRIYLTGLTLFVLGSLLCGLAPTLLMLIIARAIQGIGGGMAQPLGPALLYRAFPPKEQGTALGYFGIALVVAPALGPILGGFLIDLNLWRGIFFINIPIGIIGITLAYKLLKGTREARKPALDPLGLITAVIGFGSILYAAEQASTTGWTSPVTLILFGVGIVSLIAFTIIELWLVREPMLNLRLFQNRTFLNASIVGYVTVLALFGAEFLMPIYLQSLRGRTALQTGMILLALAAAAGIATPLAGRLYDKIGPRPLVIVGFSILIINTWQLAHLQGTTSISFILFLLALRGLALGMTVQTTFTTALGSVPLQLLPRGSSLANSTRFVIQAIAVALLATVVTSTLSPQVQALQQQAQEQVGPSNAAAFGVCETPGVAPEDNIPAAASAQLKTMPAANQAAAKAKITSGIQTACTENINGFEKAYQLTFYFSIAALLLGALLPGWPGKWGGRGSTQSPMVAGGH
ncbi:MAG: DHA2 family efflux MFS transporter permease subunit [Chloroflexi bacterium]|nr:DHA2 family efflux MFS transporter permease subunit [Chloroflexota bacterium]